MSTPHNCLHPNIYHRTPLEQLYDLRRACDIAINLLEHGMRRAAESFLTMEETPAAEPCAEFAVGNWLVRPRFPEPPDKPPFAAVVDVPRSTRVA